MVIESSWYFKKNEQHSFSTDERMLLWKCRSFWDRLYIDWGGLELRTVGFMPNVLTVWAIRATHMLSHVCEYWLWRGRYFCNKYNIWHVNYARATTFIFGSPTNVELLWKCRGFWNRKCLELRGILPTPMDICCLTIKWYRSPPRYFKLRCYSHLSSSFKVDLNTLYFRLP